MGAVLGPATGAVRAGRWAADLVEREPHPPVPRPRPVTLPSPGDRTAAAQPMEDRSESRLDRRPQPARSRATQPRATGPRAAVVAGSGVVVAGTLLAVLGSGHAAAST